MKPWLPVIAAGLLCACRTAAPLAVMGDVPEFRLTDQAGQPFDRHALEGKIWVADFMFTTCAGPCPRMSALMRRVQTSTADLADVRLVSFTVDPLHDTPPVLSDYSRHFLAQPGRWFFLTGDQGQLHNLGFNGFHLNSVDGSLMHSTRFALVDRRSRIRGYYATSDDAFLPRMLDDIRRLERETP